MSIVTICSWCHPEVTTVIDNMSDAFCPNCQGTEVNCGKCADCGMSVTMTIEHVFVESRVEFEKKFREKGFEISHGCCKKCLDKQKIVE